MPLGLGGEARRTESGRFVPRQFTFGVWHRESRFVGRVIDETVGALLFAPLLDVDMFARLWLPQPADAKAHPHQEHTNTTSCGAPAYGPLRTALPRRIKRIPESSRAPKRPNALVSQIGFRQQTDCASPSSRMSRQPGPTPSSPKKQSSLQRRHSWMWNRKSCCRGCCDQNRCLGTCCYRDSLLPRSPVQMHTTLPRSQDARSLRSSSHCHHSTRETISAIAV